MSETTNEAPPPAPPSAPSRLPFAARILGGVVVVAIVVGVGLVARELTGGDELDLPVRVGGMNADDSAKDLPEETHDNILAGAEHNSEEFSRAFDGAEAVTRTYGSLEDMRLTVIAVRADAGPPLPVGFDDPELLGTAAPRNELVEEGDVTCLLTRSAPPAADGDGDPTEEELAPTAVLCQRTGGDLTVRVFAVSEPELDDVVDATEDVWDELS